MTTPSTDYSLTGESAHAAVEAGLANAEWFVPDVDPGRMRELQRRTNGRATRDTLLWIALLVGAGIWAYSTVWSWWSIPAFALYGLLYGGAADSRWHEMGHGTAFRSRRANDVVYPFASFMLFRGPTVWRWSHHRHHTDTIIVGRDAEIAFQRPPSVVRTLFAFTHLQGGSQMFIRLVRHAGGHLDEEARALVPQSEWRTVVRESRVFVAIVVAVGIWSLAAWTPLPLLFIGGPTIYGAWLVVFFGITQHAGMQENVLDHRLNTRTVRMNPVFRFLYSNMNFHVEHHMFPSVPYHALPALHREIGDQLAPPLPNTLAAYREIFGSFARLREDPPRELAPAIPPGAGARRRIDVGVSIRRRPADGGVDLGPAADVAVGELRRLDVDDRTFVIARLTADEFALCDGVCTHAQVHLAGGALVEGQIECPKHNARFDARTGAAVRKPAREPIGTYDIEQVDGRLVSHLRTPDAAARRSPMNRETEPRYGWSDAALISGRLALPRRRRSARAGR